MQPGRIIGAASGQYASDAIAKEISKPRLTSMVDNIEKMLAAAHDTVTVIENATLRLGNLASEPKAPSEGPGNPIASSVEGRLGAVAFTLDGLLGRLNEIRIRLKHLV